MLTCGLCLAQPQLRRTRCQQTLQREGTKPRGGEWTASVRWLGRPNRDFLAESSRALMWLCIAIAQLPGNRLAIAFDEQRRWAHLRQRRLGHYGFHWKPDMDSVERSLAGRTTALRLRSKFRRRNFSNAPRWMWIASSSGGDFRRGVRFASNHQFRAPAAQPRRGVEGSGSVAEILAMGILFVLTGPLIALGIFVIVMSN
jgi:hypothetical protein